MPVLSLPVEELSHLCVSVGLKPSSEGISFNILPLNKDKGQGSCTSQYSIKFETVEEEGQGYFLRIYSVMDRPSPPSDQACKRCEEMLTLPAPTQPNLLLNNNYQIPHLPSFGEYLTLTGSTPWATQSQLSFPFDQAGSEKMIDCDWLLPHSSTLGDPSPPQPFDHSEPSTNIAACARDSPILEVSDLLPHSNAPSITSTSTPDSSSQRQSPTQPYMDSSVSSPAVDSSPLDIDGGSPQFPDSPSECDHERPLRCPHCDRRFRWEHSLRSHVRTHLSKPPKSFRCTMSSSCDQSFSRQHDRLRHEVIKHGRVCEWACGSCGKFFSSQRTFASHVCTAGTPSRWKAPQPPAERETDHHTYHSA